MAGCMDPTPRNPLMSTPDPQLDSIRRTFDAATDRLYRAKTMQEAEDELSNVLHQLYRLGELCRWRLSQPPGTKLGEKEFHKILTSSDELRMAWAAMWARAFNTHDVLMLATTYDPFGRWMPFLYGTAFAPPGGRAEPGAPASSRSGPHWVRTASGIAGPRQARAVSVGERESQVTRH